MSNDVMPPTSARAGIAVDSRIAVIIPVYHAQFLGLALRSVFEQTRQPDEVFVIDDGSPEREAIQQAVAPYAERIVLVEQVNQGAAAARNRGLHLATAPLVGLLDADDQWLPDFLEQQLQLLLERPEIDLVYCDGLVTGNTRLAGQRFMQSCPSDGAVTLESLLAQRCTVLLSGVLARRRALVRAGGFDLAIRRGQDFDLWLRMAHDQARMTYQRKVLVLRRIHEDNLSGSAVNEQERPLRILEKTLRTMALSPRERAAAERRVRELEAALAREHGKEYLRQGQFAAARREFARARHGISSWKLMAASLGLQLAPELLRRFYLSRGPARWARRRPARL
jgi:glycosyltransferase involved in cell wall biosynthesis